MTDTVIVAWALLCKVAGREILPAYQGDNDNDSPSANNYAFVRRLIGSSLTEDLMAMNDDGASFDEIADYLEESRRLATLKIEP
jgi:hypothetical protein